MGGISLCADRLGLSMRDRTMLAASVVNAMGGDIDKTNINLYSAWNRGRQVREQKAAEIKEQFEIPSRVSVHWDGKSLKLKAGQKSNRVCVHLSGADSSKAQKLLGVPEVNSGTGKEEAEVVLSILIARGVEC